MQLLSVPPFYDTMLHSLSLTGVVELQKGAYRSRHALPKELIQIPVKGIVPTKSTDAALHKKAKKKQPQKTDTAKKTKPAQPKKIRYYKIDKKQVCHRIKNYINQMPGEKMLYFWTVTFPEKTSDEVAFKCFNKWLTRLRHESRLRSYLWITERQQNGTIHFHIVINQRMCVKKANKFMRASIMHSINAGEIDYSRIDAMRYNGVDIAKDRKTRRVTNFAKQSKSRSLERYLTKYITKNNAEFTKLAWHCSRDYSNLVIAVRLTEREWLIADIRNYIDKKPLFETEWMKFYKWTAAPPPSFVQYLKQLNAGIILQFRLT